MSLECSECERDLRGGHDPSCSQSLKAWCVDRPSGTVVVIGTRADAEKRAGVMRAAGKEELMLNGPYEIEYASREGI